MSISCFPVCSEAGGVDGPVGRHCAGSGAVTEGCQWWLAGLNLLEVPNLKYNLGRAGQAAPVAKGAPCPAYVSVLILLPPARGKERDGGWGSDSVCPWVGSCCQGLSHPCCGQSLTSHSLDSDKLGPRATALPAQPTLQRKMPPPPPTQRPPPPPGSSSSCCPIQETEVQHLLLWKSQGHINHRSVAAAASSIFQPASAGRVCVHVQGVCVRVSVSPPTTTTSGVQLAWSGEPGPGWAGMEGALRGHCPHTSPDQSFKSVHLPHGGESTTPRMLVGLRLGPGAAWLPVTLTGASRQQQRGKFLQAAHPHRRTTPYQATPGLTPLSTTAGGKARAALPLPHIQLMPQGAMVERSEPSHRGRQTYTRDTNSHLQTPAHTFPTRPVSPPGPCSRTRMPTR